jgi:hypothetical protein
MLQIVDTGVSTGTPCDVLSFLDGTYKKTVKHAIELYDSTDACQLHFALESLGGFTVSTWNQWLWFWSPN